MKRLLPQIGRFATVGVGATLLHVAIAVGLNGLFHVSTLMSNFVAFAVSVSFNFLANWSWTFSGRASIASSAPKFIAMYGFSFGVSQAIVYLCTIVWAWPMWLAMVPVVIIIPALNFALSSLFVFRTKSAQ